MKKFEPPHIWIPKLKTLDLELAPFQQKFGDGEYTFRRRKADTLELIQEVGPCKNLITDYALNIIGTGSFAASCFVGTGNTPPAFTDTTLVAHRANTDTVQTAGAVVARGGAPEYWAQYAITYRFAAGTASGNLTEVGVGNITTNPPLVYNLSSRALIVDSLGNPITITVLPDEVLDVTYAIKYYPYTGADVVQTVTISGVAYTFTTRSAFLASAGVAIGSYQGFGNSAVVMTGTAAGTPPTLGPVTGDLLNPGATASLSASAVSYVNNSLTAACNWSAALNSANLAFGIRGLRVNTSGPGANSSFMSQNFQTTIAPAIPKDATKVLSFGGSISWSRKT